jgi:hypothetical protein
MHASFIMLQKMARPRICGLAKNAIRMQDDRRVMCDAWFTMVAMHDARGIGIASRPIGVLGGTSKGSGERVEYPVRVSDILGSIFRQPWRHVRFTR